MESGIDRNQALLDIVNSYCPSDQLFLWMFIDHAAFTMLKARERELKAFGLSRVQSKILHYIKSLKHDPTISELAMWIFRENCTISGITDRMVKRGLVKKYKDSKKRHVIRVSLTRKGEQAYLEVMKRASLLKILAFLEPEQCERIKGYLELIYAKAVEECGT